MLVAREVVECRDSSTLLIRISTTGARRPKRKIIQRVHDEQSGQLIREVLDISV